MIRERKRGERCEILAEAVRSGAKFYFTGRPCKHGHISNRRVSTHKCASCERTEEESPQTKARKLEATKRWQALNPSRYLRYQRDYQIKKSAALLALVELGIEFNGGQ